MGEAWYTCDYCNEPMSDYRNDIVWCDCDEHFCDEDCANEAGYVKGENGEKSSCDKCRGDVISEYKLLEFALTTLGLTRDELTKKYKQLNEL